jgi:hypothetical protein
MLLGALYGTWLNVTLLVPGILSCLLDLWKNCAHLVYMNFVLVIFLLVYDFFIFVSYLIGMLEDYCDVRQQNL